jgi:hypothetical protein
VHSQQIWKVISGLVASKEVCNAAPVNNRACCLSHFF